MSVTQKKRMSIWAWVLIAILIVAVIVLAVLHLTGIFDLSGIGETFMGVTGWAAEDVINGIILVGGSGALGMLTMYALQTYIIGTKVQTTTVGNYNPIGQQISNNNQPRDDVVVSE